MAPNPFVTSVMKQSSYLTYHKRKGETCQKESQEMAGLHDIMGGGGPTAALPSHLPLASPSAAAAAGAAHPPPPSLAAFSPLQRVALTANGNLQRLVSSFYDAPVSVRV